MQSTERANFVCEHSFGGKYGRCIATMLRMSSFFFHYGASYRKGTWWHSENVRIIFWGYRVRTETSVSVPFLSLVFFSCPGAYLEVGCLLSSPLLSSPLLSFPAFSRARYIGEATISFAVCVRPSVCPQGTTRFP